MAPEAEQKGVTYQEVMVKVGRNDVISAICRDRECTPDSIKVAEICLGPPSTDFKAKPRPTTTPEV
jgi:hypothetical protein